LIVQLICDLYCWLITTRILLALQCTSKVSVILLGSGFHCSCGENTNGNNLYCMLYTNLHSIICLYQKQRVPYNIYIKTKWNDVKQNKLIQQLLNNSFVTSLQLLVKNNASVNLVKTVSKLCIPNINRRLIFCVVRLY